MTGLTTYGDFNCPFSALASVRADVLRAADAYEIDWRAVQHDTAIPTAGEAVEGGTAAGLAEEVATIANLSDHDVRLHAGSAQTFEKADAIDGAGGSAEGDDQAHLQQGL